MTGYHPSRGWFWSNGTSLGSYSHWLLKSTYFPCWCFLDVCFNGFCDAGTVVVVSIGIEFCVKVKIMFSCCGVFDDGWSLIFLLDIPYTLWNFCTDGSAGLTSLLQEWEICGNMYWRLSTLVKSFRLLAFSVLHKLNHIDVKIIFQNAAEFSVTFLGRHPIPCSWHAMSTVQIQTSHT